MAILNFRIYYLLLFRRTNLGLSLCGHLIISDVQQSVFLKYLNTGLKEVHCNHFSGQRNTWYTWGCHVITPVYFRREIAKNDKIPLRIFYPKNQNVSTRFLSANRSIIYLPFPYSGLNLKTRTKQQKITLENTGIPLVNVRYFEKVT